MSIPSEAVFHIKPSKDYVKLSVLMYGFVLIGLYQSSLPAYLSLFVLIFLGVSSFIHLRNEQIRTRSVRYQMQRWIIDDSAKGVSYFDGLKIQMDCGFFIIVRFKIQNNELGRLSKKYKTVVFFKDQFNKGACKLLYLIA